MKNLNSLDLQHWLLYCKFRSWTD